MTAELFVAKFGAELSAFGALYYFANYLTEYRGSYGRFDLQDVLRQCGRAFLPWWRGSVGRKEAAERNEEGGTEQTGKAALWAYLRREYVDKGRDIRESAIYQTGVIAEKDVRKIEQGDELTF